MQQWMAVLCHGVLETVAKFMPVWRIYRMRQWLLQGYYIPCDVYCDAG